MSDTIRCELTVNELGWLLGCARAKLRRNRRNLQTITQRDDESDEVFQHRIEKATRTIGFQRETVRRLEAIIGESDPRPAQRGTLG